MAGLPTILCQSCRVAVFGYNRREANAINKKLMHIPLWKVHGIGIKESDLQKNVPAENNEIRFYYVVLLCWVIF